MPEYLAPGVYVEEVSFRSKSIEGVPTSTTGFAGMTRFGPVQTPGAPHATEPRLITSFTEFERVYGGLELLSVIDSSGSAVERLCYTAQAARAFFMNGGKRLYISRVFAPRDALADQGIASRAVSVGTRTAVWRARWPGSFGNVWVRVVPRRSKNVAFADANRGGAIQARRAKPGSVVEILPAAGPLHGDEDDLVLGELAVVDVDINGLQTFTSDTGPISPTATQVIHLVEVNVFIKVDEERLDVYNELGTDPRQRRYIGRMLEAEDPADENAVVWLDWTPGTGAFEAAELMLALAKNPNRRLDGGNDGALPLPTALAGQEADPDVVTVKATGLEALGEIDDIAIVALPDGGTYDDVALCLDAADKLIGHAERERYRIAVVDGPVESSMNEIRRFRGRFDSKYAAMYHPWIEVFDPLQREAQGAPPQRILLPPSGFVSGIYARSDIERGVHKAPANEVVRGLTRFEANINKGRQDVLNPEGINALRFFEGRGNRVWGARTMSSDPEWKYVNVRRLFIYIEHSIDKSTQWAVFEPNDRHLWSNIRSTVEDFLLVLWRDGALMGDKPEDAFFVRCDRTTMLQNDIDNGRMICLIGIAPVKPAEYVIFRIGQWTADAKRP
jgi:uncharacterized protein